MKTICVVLLMLGAVCAKKELQGTDCGSKNAILTLGSVNDLGKPKGRVGSTSVLEVVFSASHDTHKKDPFDTDLTVILKKKMLGKYFQLPQFAMKEIAEGIHNKRVKYLGKNVFRVNCLFMDVYGSCMPKKGPHVEKVVMKPLIAELKKRVGGAISRWLFSGWYILQVNAVNPKNKAEAFCFVLTFKLQL